jgi:mannose-6-phosphate isomerase-like protein (cupin superfamily)
MAYQGQEISNPRTGQRMKFLHLSPEELRVHTLNPPSSLPEPPHVHPHQDSGAEVLSGSLVFEVAGQRRPIAAGETITIPANTPHHFWNEGPDDAHAIQSFRPALDTAAFFETLFALAQRGHLDHNGMPTLFPLMVLVGEFGDEIRPLNPPWPLLRAVAAVLAPIARARGHQGRLTPQV